MAVLFTGFLTAQKPYYEDRVDFENEAPKLKTLWGTMEQRCFDQYLSEVDDDYRGTHPYVHLKHQASLCKQLMLQDNRRDVLQECHGKLTEFYQRCNVKSSGASKKSNADDRN